MYSLHCANGKPFGSWVLSVTVATTRHVAAPSDVRQSCAPDWRHWVAGTPGNSAQPFRSSTNEMTGAPPPPWYGTHLRSCQVAPWSVERNRRLEATRAQTTLVEGALSCASVGIGIWLGVGEGVDWAAPGMTAVQCAPPSRVRTSPPSSLE